MQVFHLYSFRCPICHPFDFAAWSNPSPPNYFLDCLYTAVTLMHTLLLVKKIHGVCCVRLEVRLIAFLLYAVCRAQKLVVHVLHRWKTVNLIFTDTIPLYLIPVTVVAYCTIREVRNHACLQEHHHLLGLIQWRLTTSFWKELMLLNFLEISLGMPRPWSRSCVGK